MDNNMESLKKYFSTLALLPPPMNSTDEYNGYINLSKNRELKNMLDQHNNKRASIKKQVFRHILIKPIRQIQTEVYRMNRIMEVMI